MRSHTAATPLVRWGNVKCARSNTDWKWRCENEKKENVNSKLDRSHPVCVCLCVHMSKSSPWLVKHRKTNCLCVCVCVCEDPCASNVSRSSLKCLSNGQLICTNVVWWMPVENEKHLWNEWLWQGACMKSKLPLQCEAALLLHLSSY